MADNSQKKKPKFRRASKMTRVVTSLTAVKPEYLFWCQGMLFFENEQALDFGTLKTTLAERMLAVGRLRSKYDFKRSGFVEIPVEEMDMDYHFTEISDVLSVDQVADEYMGNVYEAKKIDFDKPLWFVQYFPKLEDGRSLALVQVSHTIGDGVSLVELIFTLMDKNDETLEEEGVMLEQEDKEMRPKQKRKSRNPYGPLNTAKIFMGGVFQALGSVTASADSTTPLSRKNKKEFSLAKSYAFTESISLDKVKEIKNKIEGATINDVLVAVLNMIMVSYMEEGGLPREKMKKKKIRASFPINTRKSKTPILKADGSPSNKFAIGSFRFFTEYKSRTQLVQKVKKRIDKIKLSPFPYVQLKLAGLIMAVMTKKQYGKFIGDYNAQTTTQLSNVAGPQIGVKFGGADVLGIQFGLYNTNGIYLGLMSYNGSVSCCVCFDESVGDAKELAKLWKPEFDALYEEVMNHDGFIKSPKSWTTWLTKI